MDPFNASLLREKFVIRTTKQTDSDDPPVQAMSNRLSLLFKDSKKDISEHLVVRAQNMHTCLRIGAHLARDFQEKGSLLRYRDSYDWSYSWRTATKGYERKWNPDCWGAIYHKGRILMAEGDGERHPFLDIIEQCDAHNKGDYEQAIVLAEKAFKQAGKNVRIQHESNIALIVSISAEKGKCGIIQRSPSRTTTFNFTAMPKGGRDVKISQCLNASAAYLEGIQLCFLIGMARQRLEKGLLEKYTDEHLKSEDASQKISRLNAALQQFENLLSVTYRPDRPNFSNLIDEAEDKAAVILESEVRKKLASGELDPEDWIE